MDNLANKINKLLEMAKRGGTEAEMSTAMQLAQDLLLKHNLSMSDIENHEVQDEDVTEERQDGKTGNSWQNLIHTCVGKLYFCRVFGAPYTMAGKRHMSYVFVGKPTNIAAARAISNYAISLAEELAKANKSDRVYRNSFKKGFADRLWDRVEAEITSTITKLTTENTCKGLVVINPYALTRRENQDYLNSKNIRLSSGNGSGGGASNGDAFRAGQAAGNGVSLRSTPVGRLN